MPTSDSRAARLQLPRLLVALITLTALLAGSFAALGLASAQNAPTFDVRVRAQLHEDGRIEFGLRADGEVLTPSRRFLPAEPRIGRVYVSTVVEKLGVQLQVIAIRRADGSTEFGIRADGETVLRGQIFPAGAREHLWLQSSVASVVSPEDAGDLVIYSGRGESLVGGLIDRFEEQTGIDVKVRYGNTAALAIAISEEGSRSPADVYYGQDAGALSFLAEEALAAQLPPDIRAMVDRNFQDDDGRWIATSGRARVLIISPDRVPNPPDSVFDLVDPEWKGRIGWAPTNGSFQAFVTAMRQIHGDAATEEWLRGMIANDVKVFPKNTPQVQAVGDGELDIGLVNHYYLFRFDDDWPASNHFTDSGNAGALINVAGVAMLEGSSNRANALRFIRFLLSAEGQTYFRDQTNEYPVASEIDANPRLIPLDELNPPSLALTSLSDLDGTLELLRKVGALE
ncbi:MAG: iron ABC transporter substrate-binding protein [Chloroflexi bacterium]|nr:iron ABC transporter substrate-binding protein [Chloroflexota bacterium]MYC01979.1 iron ABC transporter substrate-binding protein [Chloroflexota bacterium]